MRQPWGVSATYNGRTMTHMPPFTNLWMSLDYHAWSIRHRAVINGLSHRNILFFLSQEMRVSLPHLKAEAWLFSLHTQRAKFRFVYAHLKKVQQPVKNKGLLMFRKSVSVLHDVLGRARLKQRHTHTNTQRLEMHPKQQFVEQSDSILLIRCRAVSPSDSQREVHKSQRCRFQGQREGKHEPIPGCL